MNRDDQTASDKTGNAQPQDAARPSPQPASQQDEKPQVDPAAPQGAQQQGPSMTDFSKLVAQLDQASAEAAEYKERFVRSMADFDNYRRRVTREKEEARKFAAADLVEALLPVIDNMALALQSARAHHPEAAAVLDGVDMIHNQLRSVMKSNGVEEVNPQGQPFDPNLHESIARHPSPDVPDGHVMAVTRTGYTLNGRLIRPASVVISAGPQKQEG